MEKTITRRTVDEAHVKQLVSEGVSPLLARLYAHRGVASASELDRNLQSLHSYELLKGIDDAVDCLLTAIKTQERVIVVGDFDADGATSAALSISALRAFGLKEISYLVPNRFEYGYGLTPEIVEVAAKRSPDLLITVDNGISSIEGVQAANQLGIKVLVTDHHLPGEVLPEAVAIVNPNQVGDTFPSKHLAGVGVIFYVMLALRARLRKEQWFKQQGISEPNMAQFLDLLALGTVADVVPLDKNNRILIQQGMQRIRACNVRPGVHALLSVAKRDPRRVVASDLAFGVAPRLNAAGRLDDMSLGIECLLADNMPEAHQMAAQLDQLNIERREIEQNMQSEALKALNRLKLDSKLPMGLCLYNKNWHQGVIGILAARVKEQTNRPVLAFANADDQTLKGSARSIKGLHMRDVLDAVATRHPGLLSKFGGHAMAAGVSLPLAHYEAFQSAFDEEVRRHLTDDDLKGCIESDGELSLKDLTIENAELLRDAGPWGQHFPEPLFDGVFNIIDQRLVGQRHLKMVLGLGDNSHTFDAIAFGIDPDVWPNHRCERINIAYRLDVNRYRGVDRLQLLVEYLEPAQATRQHRPDDEVHGSTLPLSDALDYAT